jgi:hypothetical protein
MSTSRSPKGRCLTGFPTKLLYVSLFLISTFELFGRHIRDLLRFSAVTKLGDLYKQWAEIAHFIKSS